MTYGYSVFSHVLWPIYIPFALMLRESTPWRRRALLAFQTAGLLVGMYLLFFLLAPVMVLYLAATCVSCFVSSHPFVRLFGLLALLSFLATYMYAARALVSVWCFFAAILSLIIFVHLRYRHLGGFPKGDRHAGLSVST